MKKGIRDLGFTVGLLGLVTFLPGCETYTPSESYSPLPPNNCMDVANQNMSATICRVSDYSREVGFRNSEGEFLREMTLEYGGSRTLSLHPIDFIGTRVRGNIAFHDIDNDGTVDFLYLEGRVGPSLRSSYVLSYGLKTLKSEGYDLWCSTENDYLILYDDNFTHEDIENIDGVQFLGLIKVENVKGRVSKLAGTRRCGEIDWWSF